MSADEIPSAMRRKAGAGRPPPEVGQLTAAKALRVALAQAAREVAGLDASAGAIEERRLTLEPMVADLPEHALMALIEGPDSRFGLAVLDPDLVAALIEIQTTGRVVPHPAVPRPPTRTDAILCADFLDRLLELVETRLTEAGHELAPALTGFRYALALGDLAAVPLTLDERPYRRLAGTVSLGEGAKTGQIQLILPFDPPGQGRQGAAEAEAFGAALRAQLLTTRAELSATLLRREMRLDALLALAPGSLIPVPRAALARIAIEDLDGRVVAHGRLGQSAGHRALRLDFAPEPAAEDAAPDDVPGFAPRRTEPAPSRADPGPPPGPVTAAPSPVRAAAPLAAPVAEIVPIDDLPDLAALATLGDMP